MSVCCAVFGTAADLLLLLDVQRVPAQARAVLLQLELRRPGPLADGVVPLAGLAADQVDDLSLLFGLCHGTRAEKGSAGPKWVKVIKAARPGTMVPGRVEGHPPNLSPVLEL